MAYSSTSDSRSCRDESYGLANVELGVPITARTRFAIGSVTKQFTAASILLLQEQGLLKTTDTLAQHYPATPDLWKNVTLRELLQHTSGIPDGVDDWGTPAFEQNQHPPEDIIKSVASKPLLFPPGSRMQYNNMGYVLLGLVVEKSASKATPTFFSSISLPHCTCKTPVSAHLLRSFRTELTGMPMGIRAALKQPSWFHSRLISRPGGFILRERISPSGSSPFMVDVS